MKTLNTNQIQVDAVATLGTGDMLLTDVQPFYHYADGKRTDEVEGYRYEVMLQVDQVDRKTGEIIKETVSISVKVAGSQMAHTSDEFGQFTRVEFENLTGQLWQDYRNNNQLNVSWSADSVMAGE